jgi:FtsP/CotA-like multicopper oxidase with cupredoxin domain
MDSPSDLTGVLRQEMSRRSVLRLAGVGVLLAGTGTLASCMSSGSSSPTSSGSAGGSPGNAFAGPAELNSSGGRLDLTLTAGALTVPWGTGSRYALGYNGSVPGPTLRVRPGDIVTVRLVNELAEPTNLHTHGLHVSSEGSSDNIFVMVAPGQGHTYEYRIPADHPSGTFWYHPHHHGTVASQVFGGMAGAIIVEDAIDDTLAATTERVLVLSDPKIGGDASVLAATNAEKMQGREGDVVLVNGILQPRTDARVGSMERWRIINASPSRYYRLATTGAAMQQISSDQGRFESPVAVTEIILTPGQRAEVLVALDQSGTVTLSTTDVSRGSMGMGGGGMGMGGGMMGSSGSSSSASGPVDLLTVSVAAADQAGSVTPPTQLRTLPEASAGSVGNRRTLTLGQMSMGNSEFVIDGRSFAPGRIDESVVLGTTEEWTLRNDSMMDHPFHLHVWPFVVVARSDGRATDPGWRDTVNVPAGQSVTIRVPFKDFGGTTVYHCHILDHEDLGMMGTIQVG